MMYIFVVKINPPKITSNNTHTIDFRSRGAVALRCFPSRWHRNDRLNTQHLILKKKCIFERKKLSMEILMEEFKPR